jgi:hypothetical protein
MKIKPVDIAEKDLDDRVTEMFLFLTQELEIDAEKAQAIMERTKRCIDASKEFFFASLVQKQ